MPCYQLALVLLSWWWRWEGKQVANTSFLGKWCQVQLAKFSESTFWYPRNQADIRWLSHWERYRTHRCHSCFIYRNLVIQVHNPKAIMSFSEAEPGWWKVLPHFIPLFLSSPELKIAGDTVSPLFSPAIFVLTPKWFKVLIIFWRDLSWPRI